MNLVEIIENAESGLRAIISQNRNGSNDSALVDQYKVEFFDVLTEKTLSEVYYFLDLEYGRAYHAVRLMDVKSSAFLCRHRQ